MAKKVKKIVKSFKKENKQQANSRKKSLIYTIISLVFILLTFTAHWTFIIPAVFFLYLGRKYLLG